MNHTTFVRFCSRGFWFRIRGHGFGFWIRNPFERYLVKHRNGNLLSQWISVRRYKP